MRYDALLIDFPTPFRVYSEKTGVSSRAASTKYDIMSWEDMANMRAAVEKVMKPDCCVFVWASCPLYPEILKLMTDGWWEDLALPDGLLPYNGNYAEQFGKLEPSLQDRSYHVRHQMQQGWGLEFKTVGFTWVKVQKHDRTTLFGGMGYWTRANAEQCWLFTRGKPGRVSKGVLQALQTTGDFTGSIAVADNIAKHSAKPDEVHRRIEELLGPKAQCLELFARRRQLQGNWTTIGYELDGLDIVDSLDYLARDEPLPVVGDTFFVKHEDKHGDVL
jgi:N6-adenosine-specific RNA methylase IME4